jgi:hypothetical protein
VIPNKIFGIHPQLAGAIPSNLDKSDLQQMWKRKGNYLVPEETSTLNF